MQQSPRPRADITRQGDGGVQLQPHAQIDLEQTRSEQDIEHAGDSSEDEDPEGAQQARSEVGVEEHVGALPYYYTLTITRLQRPRH